MGEVMIGSIARNYGISEDEARRYLGVRTRDAVSQYLSPESQRKLEEKGLGKALLTDHLLAEFKDEFSQTDEGRLWYDLNVGIRNCLVGFMFGSGTSQTPAQRVALEVSRNITHNCQRYAKELRIGQARTAARLRGVRFKG